MQKGKEELEMKCTVNTDGENEIENKGTEEEF